jgi:hypothetical protein
VLSPALLMTCPDALMVCHWPLCLSKYPKHASPSTVVAAAVVIIRYMASCGPGCLGVLLFCAVVCVAARQVKGKGARCGWMGGRTLQFPTSSIPCNHVVKASQVKPIITMSSYGRSY